jgi:hypothetical protein
VLTPKQYAEWWQDNADGELRPFDEPQATLAAHVINR